MAQGGVAIVRMRGLPFNVTKCQIYSFFDGINIVNEQDGIFMIRALDGRATGYLNLLCPKLLMTPGVLFLEIVSLH